VVGLNLNAPVKYNGLEVGKVLAKLDGSSDSLNALRSAENQFAFSSALADITSNSHILAARGTEIDRPITDAGSTGP
jgi:hypothetical protein